MVKDKMNKLSAKMPRWNLDYLYKSPDSYAIENDFRKILKDIAAFEKKYKGKLDKKLEAAVSDLEAIEEEFSGISVYFYLKMQTDASNQELKKAYSEKIERFNQAASAMAFFSIEVGKLKKSDYEKQLAGSDYLQAFKPMLDQTRKLAKYNLTEEVEKALMKRASFGASEWDEVLDELDSLLEFKLDDKKLNLSEILNVMNENKDPARRLQAMKVLNDTLHDTKYSLLRAKGLNVVIGSKMVSDSERGYEYPREGRDLSNKVSKKSVESLHEAVETRGVKYAKEYYALLAKILGKKKLSWADRNANLPFESNKKYSFDEAMKIVKESYRAFSSKIYDKVVEIEKRRFIDAPLAKGKVSGAFNYSFKHKGVVYSYVFLNFSGTMRDVETLAHELGHAVHGMLAGKTQGILQMHAPTAIAETASIFGESLVFENLLSKVQSKKEKLAMLMNKAKGFINSVVRQISFSEFEHIAHEARRKGKLTTKDFSNNWLKVSRKFYGKEGEIFSYANMDNLWSYIGHFMRPFYVYSYAYGELFTQSLLAARENAGADFTSKYIDLLASGDTKTASELMKPFKLNPEDKDFWNRGIEVSLGAWIKEAKKIYREIKDEL